MATPVEIRPKSRNAQGRLRKSLATLIFALAVGGHGLCLVVAEESGHSIQLDRSDVVIAAIRDVLAVTR